jgi:hypothetical protein
MADIEDMPKFMPEYPNTMAGYCQAALWIYENAGGRNPIILYMDLKEHSEKYDIYDLDADDITNLLADAENNARYFADHGRGRSRSYQ